MDERQNIHAGHRERMMEKFIASPQALPDHEILEMLLFAYIPRKNTNGVAHALIRTFGSLERVFSASVDELMSVEGVGKKVATALCVNGQVYERIYNSKRKDKKELFSFDKIKNEILKYFDNLYEEKFIIILLDKNYREINKLEFIDHQVRKVTGDIPEIANAFALNKPAFAIIAHNHPSGNLTPSEQDDFATAKLNLLCSTHGVTLADHVIVANGKTLSYHLEGRLQYIRDTFDLEKLLKSVKENEQWEK